MTFLHYVGDMLQTAISVARNCGMVGTYEKVIIVTAHPADKHNSARIQWEAAIAPLEENMDNCPEYSENEVNIINELKFLKSKSCFYFSLYRGY